MAVAGCKSDEMGIGPVFAVPKLLKKHGLTVDDIGLWELNEAFACQVIYSQQQLGIDIDKMNVNGGSIAFGHPLGATGCMITGMLIDELEARNQKYGLVTLCVGGGMGIATIIERV